MFAPESYLANSFLGFCAPAYTAIIWLIGIALLSANRYKRISFIILSVVLIIFHTAHIVIVYNQYF